MARKRVIAAAMSEVPASTTPSLSKGAVFLRRLSSTVVLWGVVIAALFAPHRGVAECCFLGLMLALTAAGLIEFYALIEKRGLVCFRGWGIGGGILLVASTFVCLSGWWGPGAVPSSGRDSEAGFLVLFLLGLCVRQLVSRSNPAGLMAISTTLFGVMYVAWLLNDVQRLRFFPQADGRLYLIYFVVVTKFSDTGAYAVGSLIGRHKMIPRISPGKTWEGFGGAILASTLASLAFAALAQDRLAGLTTWHAIVLGVVLSIGAVVGDLIESRFKREAGVKDSGRWFPGIGGVLDLLDSILFNAPLMYLYLRHVLLS